jgi:hypothetical protein
LHKAYCVELDRVEALRHKILTDKKDAKRRAEFFVDYGFWPQGLPPWPKPPQRLRSIPKMTCPPAPVLPPLPAFPPECIGMVCGGKGRRSGRPCQCKEIFANGRCKWHGGASTGPKTAEGKSRSLANLRRGSKL